MRSMRRLRASLGIACVIFIHMLLPFSSVEAEEDCPKPERLRQERVSIRGPSGTSHFTVEVASTAAARAAGLMCRPALAQDRGMLLLYPRPVMARIWMKNTHIPLDILFVASDGRIIQLAPHTPPGEQYRVAARAPVIAVLELATGAVARNGIQVGDQLHRPPPETIGGP